MATVSDYIDGQFGLQHENGQTHREYVSTLPYQVVYRFSFATAWGPQGDGVLAVARPHQADILRHDVAVRG
jgi:hypothetical protein